MLLPEVLMGSWVARYEEGYVSDDGSDVTLVQETHHSIPWSSPEEALQHWESRDDLKGPEVERFGNGVQQVHDVTERPEFRALRVVRIWRRVTFQRF